MISDLWSLFDQKSEIIKGAGHDHSNLYSGK